MKKCKCWGETKRIVRWHRNEPIYKTIQICNGTKECEECSCNGDESKCNFYPEKRKENKMLNTAEMWIKAQEDGKTYKAQDIRYNKTLGFHDNKGKKWNADAFEHVDDILNITDWKPKPDNEMTKSEAEARFNIKIVGD